MGLKELVTFIIPFRLDSVERERNLKHVVRHFVKTGAILQFSEQSGGLSSQGVYDVLVDLGWRGVGQIPVDHEGTGDLFWKTKLINHGLANTKTPYFGILDTDVLCPLSAIAEAVKALQSGSAGFVYPYDGRFVQVPSRYVDAFANQTLKEGAAFDLITEESVGGLVMGRTELFRQAGGANENFVSWGAEDREMAIRLSALGHTIARVSGPLYHLEHPRTVNSGPTHGHYAQNEQYWRKLQSYKTREEWKREVDSFPWLGNLGG